MTTIAKAKKLPKGAKGRLEDLEVDEVSAVDDPANKRKFIIAKSADGSSLIAIEECEMPQANTDETGVVEANLDDVLGLEVPEPVVKDADGTVGSAVSEEAKSEDHPAEQEETAVQKSVKDVLANLTTAANAVKKDGIDGSKEDLTAIAKSLQGLAEVGNGVSLGVDADDAPAQIMEALEVVMKAAGDVERVEEGELSPDTFDLLSTASCAIMKACKLDEDECERWPIAKGAKLAAVLNRQLDRKATSRKNRGELVAKMGEAAGITASTVTQILRAEINCPPIKRLDAFSKTLGISSASLVSAAQQDGCKIEKSADASNTQEETPLQFFLERNAGDNKEPEVVIKRGAKMSRTRLSRLKKVQDEVAAIIGELEGDKVSESKDDKKPVTKTTEAEPATAESTDTKSETAEPTIAEQIAKGLEEGLAAVEKKVEDSLKAVQKDVAGLKEEVEGKLVAVEKRVGEVEGANPGSNADDDPGKEPVLKDADGGAEWGSILGTSGK